MKKELALKFLRNRNINIPSLDAEGVQVWAKECQESTAEGFCAPSAQFLVCAYSGNIVYISGSGNTMMVIRPDVPADSSYAATLYSSVVEENYPEGETVIDHIETVVRELAYAGENIGHPVSTKPPGPYFTEVYGGRWVEICPWQR